MVEAYGGDILEPDSTKVKALWDEWLSFLDNWQRGKTEG